MDKKIKIVHIISTIIIIVIIGGSFYGGTLYGKSQTRPSGFGGENFQARINKLGANGSNFISGDIISQDNSSITLQIPNNGGSKIIFYSDSTQIGKTTSGTSSDLITGISVSVTGTTNSDGSVTAQSIQIRPAGQNKPATTTP